MTKKGLEFMREGMTFNEMLEESKKSVVSRRAFTALVSAGLAAGVVLKPEEAQAWNSYNSYLSGPAKYKGLADCVHEDITQISYAYALYRKVRNADYKYTQRKMRNGKTEDIRVPNIAGGLLNPYDSHTVNAPICGDNNVAAGTAPSFQPGDLKNDYDPLPNGLYAENVAFLRMGAFWNDSACSSIVDFAWNYLRCDAIEPCDTATYESVADVARHMKKHQNKAKSYDSALIKFSMGERASFLHAMQCFQPDASTPLTQGQCRQFMMQWLAVAWEYARTGDPNNIEVEGLSKEDCRDIFDAFIDTYHQCYTSYGWRGESGNYNFTWGTRLKEENDGKDGFDNKTFEDLFDDGDKALNWHEAAEQYGKPDKVNGKKNNGYYGRNPLNIRAMDCRNIPLTHRFTRLRALGMFCHTVEDSWCAAHCSRTFPENSVLKYQIVGFNHYRRQKGSGMSGANRHKPYDQVCKADTNWKPNDLSRNIRQILTYNPSDNWHRDWDFLDWFPERYEFDRGTNKLYNIAPRPFKSDNYSVDQGWEYKIFDSWYQADQEHNGTDKLHKNSTTPYKGFDVGYPVQHNSYYGFNTLGFAESINTMATLFDFFMEGYSWDDIRPWMLENTLKCALKNDDATTLKQWVNGDGTGITPLNDIAKKAESWICNGGRRSLDSSRLLLGTAGGLLWKARQLGVWNWTTNTWAEGCSNPCTPLMEFVKWQDWCEEFFNEYNDNRDAIGVCTKKYVKKEWKGYDEWEGMELIKEAYNRFAACLKYAINHNENGKEGVIRIIGAATMRAFEEALEDMSGIYNEFVIQKTGKLPSKKTTDALNGLTVGGLAALADEESDIYGDDDYSGELDTSEFDEFFEGYDGDKTEEDKLFLVTVQAIGSEEDMAFSVLENEDGTEAEEVAYVPVMFCNMDTLEPFSGWVEVDETPGSAYSVLMEYGEKAAGFWGEFLFFDESVSCSECDCVVEAIEYASDFYKAYRVFGEVMEVFTDDKGTGVVLEVHTMDSTLTDYDDDKHTTTFARLYFEANYGEDLDGNNLGPNDLKPGDLLNALLVQEQDSNERYIHNFDLIVNHTSEEDGYDSGDDFFTDLHWTAISGAPVYDVFSNSALLVTGTVDPRDNSTADPHGYAYYNEGGTETSEVKTVSGTTDDYTAWERDENGEVKLDDNGDPIEMENAATESFEDVSEGDAYSYSNLEEMGDYSYTTISTVSYSKGVLCDIPGVCQAYGEVTEDGSVLEDADTAHTMSVLVYQDSTIHDMSKREYSMTQRYYYADENYDGDDLQACTETANYMDPLYLSYMAMGMADNHAAVCGLDIHYHSNIDGTHTILCDDYICHGNEECVDEDDVPCRKSGKPCKHCGYDPTNPQKIKGYVRFDEANIAKVMGAAAFTCAPSYWNGNELPQYKSSNTKVAVVDSEGKVTLKGAGTAIITATVAETEQYTEASASYTLTVTKAAGSIKFAKASVTKAFGAAAFTIALKKAGDGKVTYKSSNRKVAVVSSTGKVTLKGVGTCTITATVADGSSYSYAAKTAKYTLTVNPKRMKIKKLTAKKAGFKATWAKQGKKSRKQITGFQVRYATNKSMKNAKTALVAKNTASKKSVSKLLKKKAYYVQLRAYKKVNGKKFYGAWSVAKKVTTKK